MFHAGKNKHQQCHNISLVYSEYIPVGPIPVGALLPAAADLNKTSLTADYVLPDTIGMYSLLGCTSPTGVGLPSTEKLIALLIVFSIPSME